MAAVVETVKLDRETLARVQQQLVELQLDGWLLYDFRGLNRVAGGILGLPALSRRYFVLLPAKGAPVAITHRIEQQPWTGWIGENRPYLSWPELEGELRRTVQGLRRVAMEYSPGDAVPYLDCVPAGVVEMVQAQGVLAVSSSDLVSAFYSRWSQEGLASHRRSAAVLEATAHDAFRRVGELLKAGETPTEHGIQEWIRGQLRERGLAVGGDTIVAVNANAANPHYAPSPKKHVPIGPGDLLLIDLWGKETDDAVYADQTWMAYVGEQVPDRLRTIWEAVRDGREAAVSLAVQRWRAGEAVAGFELDDATREVIRQRGYADHFIHRTGHSIDRELHGSGPNIDNLETRDTRRLIPGIGFSVEPGVYLPGDVGFRSEIDVYMGDDGPEVTTPNPQRDIFLIQAR